MQVAASLCLKQEVEHGGLEARSTARIQSGGRGSSEGGEVGGDRRGLDQDEVEWQLARAVHPWQLICEREKGELRERREREGGRAGAAPGSCYCMCSPVRSDAGRLGDG